MLTPLPVSGHGGQVDATKDKNEIDGFDEGAGLVYPSACIQRTNEKFLVLLPIDANYVPDNFNEHFTNFIRDDVRRIQHYLFETILTAQSGDSRYFRGSSSCRCTLCGEFTGARVSLE